MSKPKFTVLLLAITFAVLSATSADAERDNMKIRISMNGNEIAASLIDNATSRDFVSLLPLKLKLEDYGETEKIGYLPRKLSTEGALPGSDPSVGDVTYYAPWVLDSAPAHIRPAIALMMFTGLAPKDALRLPRPFYKEGEIAARRSKTGEPVFWPAPAALVDVLSKSPSHDAVTLCANSFGRPWTESGFRASWRTVRSRLEKEGRIGPSLTLYGLRHTVAVILRESGADERTIADALGQKTIEMARHYAKGADLKRKMRGVVADFDAEVNRRRTKIVKPT